MNVSGSRRRDPETGHHHCALKQSAFCCSTCFTWILPERQLLQKSLCIFRVCEDVIHHYDSTIILRSYVTISLLCCAEMFPCVTVVVCNYSQRPKLNCKLKKKLKEHTSCKSDLIIYFMWLVCHLAQLIHIQC